MLLEDDITKLNQYIGWVEEKFHSLEDWENKYNEIFAVHANFINPLFNKIGINFDWYDPDTSYKEDVKHM